LSESIKKVLVFCPLWTTLKSVSKRQESEESKSEELPEDSE